MAQDIVRDFYRNLNRYVRKCNNKKYYKYKIKIIRDFLLFVKKELNKRKLNQLEKKDIDKFINSKKRNYAERTLKNYKTIINNFFKRASIR